MIINHNLGAINAQRNMGINSGAAAKAMEKLSSGLRINRAGDDAAGLSISEKMRAQIRGLDQASTNAEDGISLIQTAEGALNETHSILQRMRELSVQASNDTNTDDDRKEIQKEIDQLKDEVTRISTDTEFNTKKLLDGSIGGTTVAGTTNASITGSSYVKEDDSTKLSAAGAGRLNAIKDLTGDDAKLEIEIDGKKLEIDLTYDASDNAGKKTSNLIELGIDGLSSGANVGANLTNVANALQTDINNAIANYNKNVAASEQIKDVTVTVGTDGGLVIESGTAGDKGNVKISKGEAAELLGLSDVSSKTQGSGLQFQIGANEGQNMSIKIDNMSAAALSIDDLDITSAESATAAITTVDDAIKAVSSQRANLGAVQNRLEHTVNNLGTSSENLTAAESRIRDTDMASEMSEYSKNNILQQAAQAMLAQAKSAPQQVLQLLQ